jgi:hypothetical protein
MNIDYLDQTIDENHRIAYRIIHFFFSCTDFFYIFLFLFIYRCNVTPILHVFSIMSFDVLVRIVELSSYFSKNSFSKELLLSFLASVQFYLLISYINKSFMNSTFSINQNGIGTPEYFLFTFSFGMIIFPFEIFMFYDSNLFWIFKFVFIFISIYLFNTFMMNKFKDFLLSLSEKAHQNILLLSIIQKMPGLAFYSFSSICFIKMIRLTLINQLYVSYLEMGLISLKETGKYALFILLGAMSVVIESDQEYNRSNENKYGITVNQPY